jgi:ABC-type transporter Mla subunit MlaD
VRLPLPGPRDLLGVLERGAAVVEQLVATLPRVLSLLEEAHRLLTRVDDLIDRIEGTRADADAVVRRTTAVAAEAEELLARSGPLVDRLTPLLDGLEPPLVRLQPTLQRLAETTDPREVDAMVALVDHLPGLAARMETDILPVLDSLSTVAPDLHDLLDVSRELNEMLASLPGLGRLKRRIDAEQEAARRNR